jgi:peptidyl-prolyl cis-trans isomerase SurA
MIKDLLVVFIALFGGPGMALAQDNDPVLFTVAGEPVRVSEFKYIYNKTNGKNADYSRASLQEYLDLYTKFKLKVHKAKDMKLDTIESLKEELNGYRRQLADSYLTNKQVNEKLARELYEHSKQDVDISHIQIPLSANPSAVDTLAAYKLALTVRAQLEGGADFATVARETSSDKSAATNGGRIGFVTAMFPNGLYSLEKAAYSMPLGQLSMPLRSGIGYHILKVNARRPARGEVEVSHILLRTESMPSDIVKVNIDTVYAALQRGANFEDKAAALSEDTRSKDKGGYVGFVTIGRFEQEFEDAAYSIDKDGGYSKPFQTSVGWHIIKRISRKENQPFDESRAQLEARIKRDARYEEAKKAMVDDIKKANGFKSYPDVVNDLGRKLDESFFNFQWRKPEEKMTATLFTLGKETYTLDDYGTFLEEASRQRMRMAGETTPLVAVQNLLDEYINQACLRFEEKTLDQKYPDFKALLREYEEGILLFEATRINVWDKASQDTVGLKNYFKTIKGKYRWDERAVVSLYRLDGSNANMLDALRAYTTKNSPKEVLERFNKSDTVGMRVEEELLEKDKSPEAKEFKAWKAGETTTPKLDRKANEFTFRKIEKVMPAQDKALNEARGYIIADYQDFLEAQWVSELRKQFLIKVEKAVFDAMVKK